jgi:putative glutamine amidotransferase
VTGPVSGAVTGTVSGGRPLIALTSYHEPAVWGVWNDVPAALLPWTYVRQVTDAGGAPILLPPVPSAIRDVLARVDALLLTGGPDIDPARYGAQRDAATQPARPARDEAELAALAAAEERGIPVLAICRGAQLLSVARGGSLHQHLPGHAPRNPGHYDANEIRIAAGTRLAAALGESATLACAHHQGIDQVGTGLKAVAWAADGTIEGTEDPSARFVLGVQAHPEEGPDTQALFEAFVAAAR